MPTPTGRSSSSARGARVRSGRPSARARPPPSRRRNATRAAPPTATVMTTRRRSWSAFAKETYKETNINSVADRINQQRYYRQKGDRE